MDNTNYNHSIKCSVTECTHHAKGDDYCALSQIKVGSSTRDHKDDNDTDCESFKTS
jgi:hypothetical protein